MDINDRHPAWDKFNRHLAIILMFISFSGIVIGLSSCGSEPRPVVVNTVDTQNAPTYIKPFKIVVDGRTITCLSFSNGLSCDWSTK